jgi:hypothetical protein
MISVLRPHREQLGLVSEFCELMVDCFGSSDSVQGGYWISPESLRGVADLNVELFVTVYLEDGASGPTGAEEAPV